MPLDGAPKVGVESDASGVGPGDGCIDFSCESKSDRALQSPPPVSFLGFSTFDGGEDGQESVGKEVPALTGVDCCLGPGHPPLWLLAKAEGGGGLKAEFGCANGDSEGEL